MAEIAAKDVAALRKITGAGMMDCKKALAETDGDIERAKDWLREKGIAGAAKRAGRDADQGAVDVARRRATSARSSSSTARPTSSPRATSSRQASASLAKLVVEQGDADLGAQARSTARRSTTSSRACRARSARRSSSAASSGSRPPTACSTRTSTSRTSAASSACSSSSAASTRPTPRRARSRTTSRCTSRARRPATSRRDDVPADDVEREREIYEAQTTRRGQARAGVAQDRRGQAQRVLQARSRCSSSRS